MVNNKRLDYLDYVKGFGILLVILGHIYTADNYIKIWIYSFHMPLFFIISGLLIKHTNLKERNIKNIISSKFKSLIIPYVYFELLAIFMWMIQNEFTLSALRWNLIDSILMYCRAGATWFLPCLFVSEIIFIFMIKNIKSHKIKLLFLIFLFLIPFIIKTENHYIIIIFRCFTAIGYISFGYYMHEYIVNKDLSYNILFILSLGNIILGELNGCIDLWSLNFKNPILYIGSSILGTLFVIFAFKKINQNQFLKYFGVNTVIIMSTQQVILDSINKYTGQQKYGYIIGIVIFIITILIEIPIIEVINRYMPFMLGKFKKKQVISD